jgi:hypothetical protein
LPSIIFSSDATVLNNGWVNSFSDADLYSFYSFYNTKLTPNTLTSVITSITPTNSNAANKAIEITIRADVVAYSGNAYKKESQGQVISDIEKPFGNLNSQFLSTWTAWQ